MDNNNGDTIPEQPQTSVRTDELSSGNTTPTPDNEDKGVFDFRSVLKPTKREVKKVLPPKEEPQTPDYRAVLKKRALYPEELKSKKQIVFKS